MEDLNANNVEIVACPHCGDRFPQQIDEIVDIEREYDGEIISEHHHCMMRCNQCDKMWWEYWNPFI